jgi:hypothetical protein
MTHVEFEDPEVYSGNKQDKIDFQLILFKQIDKIRYERTNIIQHGEINDSGYVAAVQSFKLLLTTYLDEKFRENMKNFKSKEKHPIKNRIEYYDKMFEELLFVCERTKLIGGELTIM